MRLLTQSLVMSRISLASLPERIGPSLVIVISMACVVGVLLSMLSATAGMLRTYQQGADPGQAIVFSAHGIGEGGNGISLDEVGTVLDAPGIAKGPDGHLAADPEVLFWVPPTGVFAESPLLRGIGASGLLLHPGFTLASGRLLRSGRRELIVGVGAERAYGLKVGDTVILPSGEWPIVGTFSAAGSILEGELVGDRDTIMSENHISGFASVFVRLRGPDSFAAFSRWLTSNPTLAVTAERLPDYYARTANLYSAFFTRIAYAIGLMMGLGAVFGAVKIMYAAVSSRMREIATLRAIGYNALPVAIAVVFEMILLSLLGTCCGACLAWLLFDGKLIADSVNVFNLSVSPRLFALGLGWALALAIIGGLPPAIRGARLSVTDALRAV